MAWQETQYWVSEGMYDIVAPPPEQAVIGDLQVVADTTDCQHIVMGYRIWVYGGGDEYTNTMQYFDETEQAWIDLETTQMSPGGGGGIGYGGYSQWCPLPAGAQGSAVTFRPVGIDGDSTTTATVSEWFIRVRKQV